MVEWRAHEDQRQATLEELSNAVTNRLIELSNRARIIANDVYDRGAPILTVSASPDQNKFMREVAQAVDEVVREFGGELE